MAHEFSLIRKIRDKIEDLNLHHTVLTVPPGDDAALLTALACPVITTDCQKQDVHFRLDWQTPEEIGFKAVVVTLSDLAASYARPQCLFINLGIPDGFGESSVLQLYDGICDALTLYPCALGGGNTSKGPVLTLDLFAIGQGTPDLFPLRSNAGEGQGLYVTGPLGLARCGLDALERGDNGVQDLIRAFKRPRARFDAARILEKNGISCVMDISDGLAGDALHLAEESSISIRFDMDASNIPEGLKTYCGHYGLSAPEMVLAGGEDYELLFTCDPNVFESMKKELKGAYRVGECLPYNGKYLINPPESARSFTHDTRD